MSEPSSQLVTTAKVEVLGVDRGFKSGALATQERSMIETALSREAQIVQAAMVMAKQFPRDQLAAYQRVLRACERPGLAEAAVYCYPRGGTQVTGPSIRLAEELARSWGNIDFGITELEQRPGFESIVMAYCTDLETNTHERKVFTVPHVREKRGGNEILRDPRDIYELVANQGARRLRSCILAIIPGDVVDDALAKCEETMSKRDQAEGPLGERIKKLANAFQKLGVTPAMMEMRLGKKSEAWTEFDYSTLKKIFLSIRDGYATKEQHFSYEATQDGKPAPEKGAPNFPPAAGGGGSPGNGGSDPQPQPEKPAPPAPQRQPRPPRQQPPPTPPTPPPPAEKPAPQPPDHPPAPAPEVPPSDDLPLPGGEPAPAPAAPETPGDTDEDDPKPVVVHLIKTTSGVDGSEVMRWLVENRVITKAPNSIGELPREALALLVEKWGTVTSDIRGD